MKRISKIVFVILCVILCSGFLEEPATCKANEIKVTVDNKEVAFDVAPVIRNGYTLVPVRAIAEALGADVVWDEQSRSVRIENTKGTVVMFIDSVQSYVNGETVSFCTPATIIDQRAMVPVRAIAEAFGCLVNWNETERTVEILNYDVVGWWGYNYMGNGKYDTLINIRSSDGSRIHFDVVCYNIAEYENQVVTIDSTGAGSFNVKNGELVGSFVFTEKDLTVLIESSKVSDISPKHIKFEKLRSWNGDFSEIEAAEYIGEDIESIKKNFGPDYIVDYFEGSLCLDYRKLGILFAYKEKRDSYRQPVISIVLYGDKNYGNGYRGSMTYKEIASLYSSPEQIPKPEYSYSVMDDAYQYYLKLTVGEYDMEYLWDENPEKYDSTFCLVRRNVKIALENVEGFAQGNRNCTSCATALMMKRRQVVDSEKETFNLCDVRMSFGLSREEAEQGKEVGVAWGQQKGFSDLYSGEGKTTFYTKTLYAHQVGSTVAERKQKIISLLEKHPEGIVIYCKTNGREHAIVLTDYDYETDTFYACDSVDVRDAEEGSKEKCREKLQETYLYRNYGKSVDTILSRLKTGEPCVWYVERAEYN